TAEKAPRSEPSATAQRAEIAPTASETRAPCKRRESRSRPSASVPHGWSKEGPASACAIFCAFGSGTQSGPIAAPSASAIKKAAANFVLVSGCIAGNPYPGIEPVIGEIDDEIHGDDRRGVNNRHAKHEGIITV